MERRFLLAVSLMIAVLVVPTLLFKRPPARRPVPADTTALDSAARPAFSPAAPRPPVTAAVRAGPPTPAAVPAESAADTVWLATRRARYQASTLGGVVEHAVLDSVRSFAAADHDQPAQLVRRGDRLLAQRLVFGSDTVRLDSVVYSATRGAAVELTGRLGALAPRMRVSTVPGNEYLLDVSGEIGGLEGRGALLMVGLGHGLRNVEADSVDNYHQYGVTVRRSRPETFNFRSLDPGEIQLSSGPFDWVAVKSKYFIAAILSADSARPQFGGAVMIGGPRTGRVASDVETWVTMPVGPDGRYHYQFYLGPQTHQALGTLGRDLDRATTYGWIFKPLVMPVAGWFTRLFIWMHTNLRMSYGVVLILFGVLVRLVLWPLNQKAMKSQVAMMAVQPLLQDLREKYKNDPQKQQQEMMRIYKEHNVNPLGGCLPLLLPMPVLLALFFVFSRAIELRGTPFLWLPDLSLRDPLYITPIVMGLSMFALSKLSSKGMPPNPQTKMLTFFMPVMMTVLFLNFASGLNLYYAVSNIVSLPQQWLINKSRMAEMARRNVSSLAAAPARQSKARN